MVELLERATALSALADSVAAATEGQGSVALVTGEHGIGKTSLVTHFSDAVADGVRLLWGSCDDLSTPRPLGPFRDLAADLPDDVAEQLRAGGPAHELADLLLADFRDCACTTVVVLEDLHWADAASLDLLTLLGRRLSTLRVLLLLTVRTGETAPDHPLHAALAAVQRATALHLSLAPLSRDAVASLAGDRAARVYDASGGNPFFVSELIADAGEELPLSVANAVHGRLARLPAASRDLVELVAMVPGHVEAAVLDVVRPGWAEAATEPERRRLLTITESQVRFRHELAREAIRSGVPKARQRTLHGEILDALERLDAEPARLVHHADAAGRAPDVAVQSLRAARHAAALESHREARQHFRRAGELTEWLDPAELAPMYEAHALAASNLGHMHEAFTAMEEAIARYRAAGDRDAVSRCLGLRSHFYWVVGDGGAAREQARSSVDILDRSAPSDSLASAYNQLCDLATLAGRTDEAMFCGDRALRLAEQVGNDTARWRALVTMAVAGYQRDPDAAGPLRAAVEGAQQAGVHDAAVKGLIGLTYVSELWVQPDAAERYAAQGIAHAEAHSLDSLGAYLQVHLAWLRMRRGDWHDAEKTVRTILDQLPVRGTVADLLAHTLLAEVAVRRGDADADDRLAATWADAERTGELLRLGPVLELWVEWALTRNAQLPAERFDRAMQMIGAEPATAGCGGARLVAWGLLAGVPLIFSGRAPRPHAAMMRCDWPAAAAAFGDVGWTYDQALMLSLCDDEASLTEGLAIAREFGAGPLMDRIAGKLRAMGKRVHRGSSRSTRTNPAGLTDRQVEILTLLGDGLTNAEIADRLSISPRTAEHHVSGILLKLEVDSRREAARRAADLLSRT